MTNDGIAVVVAGLGFCPALANLPPQWPIEGRLWLAIWAQINGLE